MYVKKNPCELHHFIWSHNYFCTKCVPPSLRECRYATLLNETYSPPSHLLMHGFYNLPLWFSRRQREKPCSAISLSSSAASQPVMNEACISDQYYLWGITGRPDSHTSHSLLSASACVDAGVTRFWSIHIIYMRQLFLVFGFVRHVLLPFDRSVLGLTALITVSTEASATFTCLSKH